jgi:putative FmdB family regulatory protein
VPTYSYACTACGHRFDAQQAFTDDALTECPVCGGRLRKLFGNVGVVFKGSGFYRTDARKDGDKRSESQGGDSTGSTDQGSGAKTPASEKPASGGASTGGGSTEKAPTGPAKGSGKDARSSAGGSSTTKASTSSQSSGAAAR